MRKQHSIYLFESFLGFPDIIHGFSTRDLGDMRPSHEGSVAARERFAETLGINPEQIVRMFQSHSNHVERVDENDCDSEIERADGLLTAKKNVFLSVMSGDCIPLLFFDRNKKIVAAVHAGWRGLQSEIIVEAVEQMKSLGSHPVDIMVGIGPCIRSCCYTIDGKREALFQNTFLKKYGEPLEYLIKRDGKTYLNMPYLAKKQLLESGILEEHIEDSGLCTFTTPDLYSYRREGEHFGEFLGIIGRR